MPVYEIDPLRDLRWPAFLAANGRASVFHTPEWLEALQRTYGYEPVAYTTTPPEQSLRIGAVFCRVESWLTGSRLVSLPFSDHCEPLASGDDWAAISTHLQQRLAAGALKYIEIRPGALDRFTPAGAGFNPREEYWFHRLELRPELNAIYRNFHPSCVQRKIQRAERERLGCEAGNSETLLDKFYYLLLLTRRRHGLPPQPLPWFRNLCAIFSDRLTIHIASKDGRPIASILTLRYKRTLIYKYGCSDSRYHNMGGMPLLFWRAIRHGKEHGAEVFDLGRSDVENTGLLKFKQHLGAAASKGSYFRLEAGLRRGPKRHARMRLTRGAFARMPRSFAQAAGSLLYRHMG